MSNVREEYLRALHDVSKTDPHKWETFLEAFKALVNEEYEKSLSTPSSEALLSIGSNRRLRDIKYDFMHIDNIWAKLKK
jgi:hypothetical protein